jgi:nucleotidyltransferase/DNA polymerase involved in DNA repair
MRVFRRVLIGFWLLLFVWLWLRQRNEERIASLTPLPRGSERRSLVQDDLTTIVGIGPVYAAALNRIGIQSFRQLAAQNADSLAARLTAVRVSAARIRRDRWIEQAGERSQSHAVVWSGNDNGHSTKIDYTE